MIAIHPAALDELGNIVACIEPYFDCEQACTSCVDACLYEEKVADLRHCVRTNLDCADVCSALGRALPRASTLMRSLIQACINACNACGEECRRHASMHEHCKHCADTCQGLSRIHSGSGMEAAGDGAGRFSR